MIEQATLNDIVKRIVDVADPEKIILFGSAARGDSGRNSDVDLLIIKDGEDALTLMSRIYGVMQGVGSLLMLWWSHRRTLNASKTVTR